MRLAVTTDFGLIKGEGITERRGGKKNEKHRGVEKQKPRKQRKNTQSKNRDKRKHKTQKTND